MKVALCFWGLCRSTHVTIKSIQTHIYDALKQQGIEYDIFSHTYTLQREYTNIRADEIKCRLDNENYKLLRPDYSIVEDQDVVDRHLSLEAYRTKGDPWCWDTNAIPFATLDNHVRALWSLYQVTMCVEKSKEHYDYIVFLRPDVTYLQPLRTDYFLCATDYSIVIPDFHLFFGSNDRFAICTPGVAKLYGTRFKRALDYSKQKLLHAEGYLTHILKEANIHIQTIPFRFRRVRANGRIAPVDKEVRAHT
jgi:hypothetical protein